MATRLTKIAGLMLGLSLVGGGAAVASAHEIPGAVPAYTAAAAHGLGAGLDAGLPFQWTAIPPQVQAEDPACALEPSDAAEEAEDPNDTDNIQDENEEGADNEGNENGESENEEGADNEGNENGAEQD